jgi:uncharacterized protein
MEMNGQRVLAAPAALVWEALNNPLLLQRSIAGCESFEASGENSFASVVAVKLGPVSAKFKADIRLSEVQAPHSYTIHFDGKGGVAGFGKGSADIRLEDQGDSTLLSYSARAQVGGKLAQIGSRLIDAAASKLTEDFFTAFEKEVMAEQTAVIPEAKTQAIQGHALSAQAPPRKTGIFYGVLAGLAFYLIWLLLRK